MKNLLIIPILFFSIPLFAQKRPVPAKKQLWCNASGLPASFSKQVIDKDKIVARLADPDGVIVVPVVFHVVYNNSTENIADALLLSQIDRLNTDFRKLNSDVSNTPSVWSGLTADIKIEFKLACIDPSGNATTGIVRKFTSQADFTNSTLVKSSATGGDDPWPANTYLNIWVYDIATAAGFLGDGTLPEAYSSYPQLDGITLDYSVVGDNNGHATKNMGRVATHEAGHWLGLVHPFLPFIPCIDDGVSDTPLQHVENETCPSFPKLDACSPVSPGVMFMNYMDIPPDNCRYMFTAGQKTKMRGYFSATGPNPVRYPFLENYFSIKEIGSTVCLTSGSDLITVYLKNPACLTATYSFTGPVTEVSHDNQKIIFSINSGTTYGTINLTANGAPNYTDDYAIPFIVASAPTITNPMIGGIAVQKVEAGQTYTCSITSTIPGAIFNWEITGGTIVSGQGTTSIDFIPNGPDAECPILGRIGRGPDRGDEQVVDPVCSVLIKVGIGVCPSPKAEVIFEYDPGCGPVSMCCEFPGQTCCTNCRLGNIMLYPNPAKDQVTIETSGNSLKMIVKAEVFDINGTRIRSLVFAKGTKKINLRTSDLKPGDYFIRLFDGEKWESTKLRISW